MTTVTNKTPRTMSAQLSAAYAHETVYADMRTTMFNTKARTIKVARTCATTGMSLEEKVVYKAMRLVCRRAHSRDAIKARTPRNSAAKRAEIHGRDQGRSVVNTTKHTEVLTHGSEISDATKAARQAQSSAQLALNAVRALARAIEPKKAHVVHTHVVHTPTSKVRAPKRVRVYHMMHTVESVAANAATKAAVIKAKVDKEIARARRAAQRKVWIQLRAEKVARMCANAWYNKGIWIDPALAEACNDSDYSIRVSAYTELCALVGVAA